MKKRSLRLMAGGMKGFDCMSVLQKQLDACIRDINEVFPVLGIKGEEADLLRTITERYPISIPPYYLNLVDPSDPEDPIRKLCIPSAVEIGAGHSVTVLYELKLDDMAYALNSYWMNLSVRYKRPAEDKAIEENYPIGAESFTDDPGDPFRFASAVAETCMIIRESRYIGDITLENIIETLDGCDTSGDIYKAQFKELIKALNEER